ncbi:hypothetical protein C1H46_039943 [Malus baccata]|uniref:WAT1-related protein n=1 Tax=Malus baccata TaxID=106549 RepID=A0A540KKG9_MALBA|nr:hypothetical protein C1H46_039943 [Malus baccata]
MVLNKAAMSKGTNAYIIVVYANAIAALILLPSALIFHRLIIYNPSFFHTNYLIKSADLVYYCTSGPFLSKVLTVLLLVNSTSGT